MVQPAHELDDKECPRRAGNEVRRLSEEAYWPKQFERDLSQAEPTGGLLRSSRDRASKFVLRNAAGSGAKSVPRPNFALENLRAMKKRMEIVCVAQLNRTMGSGSTSVLKGFFI
jgi:hypothetical protein